RRRCRAMTGQDWLEKDFYATLGVSKDADAAEIKKAYRKLARKWHPDQNPGDASAEQKFKEIGEAYGVLSDPEQRKQYDSLRAMAGGGMPGGGGFEDILSGMFGGGSPGGRAGFQRGPVKGGDITTSASLPFRSAVEGATVNLTLDGTRSMKVRIPAGVHDGQK